MEITGSLIFVATRLNNPKGLKWDIWAWLVESAETWVDRLDVITDVIVRKSLGYCGVREIA